MDLLTSFRLLVTIDNLHSTHTICLSWGLFKPHQLQDTYFTGSVV